MLQREIETLTEASHPNLMNIFEYIVDENKTYYIISECVTVQPPLIPPLSLSTRHRLILGLKYRNLLMHSAAGGGSDTRVQFGVVKNRMFASSVGKTWWCFKN